MSTRTVADRTYVQTLEVAQPARDTPRRDRGGAVGGGLRQVDHRACATLDPPDRDLVRVPPQPEKAAAIIADWVTLLIDALDDLDRLIAVLSRMKDVLLKAGARVQNRNIHPSLSQLLQNPILLDYEP